MRNSGIAVAFFLGKDGLPLPAFAKRQHRAGVAIARIEVEQGENQPAIFWRFLAGFFREFGGFEPFVSLHMLFDQAAGGERCGDLVLHKRLELCARILVLALTLQELRGE